MIKNLLVLTLIILSGNIHSQMRKKNPEETIRFLADKVIEHTHRAIMNKNTGEVFESTDGLPISPEIQIKSINNEWYYRNGVLNLAMIIIGETLNDPKYINYSLENYDFIFQNIDYFKKQYETGFDKPNYFRMFSMSSLDDCGTMGAGLIETYNIVPDNTYKRWIDDIADYISNEQIRMEDGTFIRDHPREFTLWSDDLYMCVSFLVRMGKITGDPKYFDDAVNQVINFTKYLFDEYKGLYYHCYYTDTEKNGVAHWGRANGWVMMAQVDLLDMLPEDHPKRDTLISILNNFIIGISRFQSSNGLWHQLLDKTDSYLESSVSAMFIYGVAKSVNEGWIHPSYGSIARRGWNGLYQNITEEATVKDICVGTHIEQDLVFYYNRPKSVNDSHGLAATLMAGTEIIQMETWNRKK